jgi:osmoprotectant transport system permease protein
VAVATPTAVDVRPPRTFGARLARRSPTGYLAMPAVLAAVTGLLYAYVRSQELDSIERRALNADTIVTETLQHIELTAVSTVVVLLIAIPVAVVLTRGFARRAAPAVLAVFNTGQAVPSIGLLALFAVMFTFIGYRAAIVGLVAYASLSVLRNTMVGLEGVDRSLLEAGRGMGLTKLQVLTRIELPLAVPVILAGVRTALVINVGSATLAAFVNAGGLGRIILAGLTTNRFTVQLTGAVLTAVLALLIDYLGGVVEDVLRPAGLS